MSWWSATLSEIDRIGTIRSTGRRRITDDGLTSIQKVRGFDHDHNGN